jgi:predicted acylesterase/phospholipase RssA
VNEGLHPVRPSECNNLPGQVVLVFQGGGALGSYQAGVYQALHEADIEPDWIISADQVCANLGATGSVRSSAD